MGKLKIIVIVAVLAVAAGGVGLWWYLRDDAPDKVSIDKASEGVSGSAGGSAKGTWKVDPDAGSFDFQSATGTFAGFRVDEELSTVGATTAVGRTGDVTGTVTIGDTALEEAKVDVDLTSITTDRSLRDGRVQSALETSTFPKATFELTKPVDLGDAVATGKRVKVKAVGDLTLHGVTKPVTVTIEGTTKGENLIVVGSTDIDFTQFGVEQPKAPIVASVSKVGTIEFQLILARS